MNISKTIAFLLITFVLLFFISFKEEVVFNVNKIFFNPCSSPIEYTIGDVDPNFGLSRDDFTLIVKQAANEWNNAFGKELFSYTDKGMKINLLYDYRQNSTFKMENIDLEYKEDYDVYTDLTEQYDTYIIKYENKNNELERMVTDYNQRSSSLEKDILLWNKSKKQNEEEYNRFKKEKEDLELILSDIHEKQNEVMKISKDINYLVEEINKVAERLNINVDEYNAISKELSNQFEQGNYIKELLNKEINIYQFEDKESLRQVLIHEFGHSLGLKHSTGSEDIMYWINTEVEQEITQESLIKLRAICYE